jgi:DNA (cytosine-5)-methyltransferase 1
MVGAIDAWDVAANTYRDNFPTAKVVCTKLRGNNRSRALESIRAVDLVIASPECTQHSIARGAKPRNENSSRSGWFVLPFIEDMAPRWIVIENVSRMRSWSGFGSLMARLERCGYKLNMQILDAADFGVPQTRRRLFIVGDRVSQPGNVPIPKRKVRTVGEILDPIGTWKADRVFNGHRAAATLERIKAGIKEVGRGTDFLTVYYSSDRAGGWQTLDRPLRTLTTLDRFGLVQWIDGEPTLRMLQVSELRRAMGLPRSFLLEHGSRRDKIKLLGNGVCAPVMKHVVASLFHNDLKLQAAE